MSARALESVPSRVVICEDSPTYAAALQRALQHEGACSVVGVFATAEQTLAALPALRPDLVTMDMVLPGMAGLEAIELIMSTQPTPILVVSGRLGGDGLIEASALAAGALDALPKGGLDLVDPAGPSATVLRSRVSRLSGVRVIRHPRANLRGSRARASPRERSVAAIGMCASTGGPQALTSLLTRVPASFPIPILVVQHIAPSFIAGLARWLDQALPLPVRLAEHGAKLSPGVYIAPEDAHLTLGAGGRIALCAEPATGIYRPSADVLFASLAERLGPTAAGIVLTGMGRDGALGLRAVRLAGGLTIAQDEQSSTIFGMPKAAIEQGSELILGLDEIPAQLATLTLAAT